MADSTATRALPFADYIDKEVTPWRQSATLLGALAALALVVASAGLYALVAYLVADRTHEMGVRMALGASPSDIVGQIVGGGVRLVAVVALGRLIEPLLYEVSSRDPLLLGLVALIMLGVAAIAAYLPARRATRIDPMTVLRAE